MGRRARLVVAASLAASLLLAGCVTGDTADLSREVLSRARAAVPEAAASLDGTHVSTSRELMPAGEGFRSYRVLFTFRPATGPAFATLAETDNPSLRSGGPAGFRRDAWPLPPGRATADAFGAWLAAESSRPGRELPEDGVLRLGIVPFSGELARHRPDRTVPASFLGLPTDRLYLVHTLREPRWPWLLAAWDGRSFATARRFPTLADVRDAAQESGGPRP